jgi:hypothetical protein
MVGIGLSFNYMKAEKSVKIADMAVEEMKKKPITMRHKIIIAGVLGFLAGWFWMTWAMLIEHQIGLPESFWRLLLPF